MFAGITWTHYVTIISMALLIYYSYVWLRYGRKVRGTAAKQKKETGNVAHMGTYEEPDEEHFADDLPVADELFDQVQEMLERVTNVINVAAGSGSKKEDLTVALRAILSRYPQLNITAFREGINERILTTCNNTDLVVLTEREVDELW